MIRFLILQLQKSSSPAAGQCCRREQQHVPVGAERADAVLPAGLPFSTSFITRDSEIASMESVIQPVQP
jgi:hypothetical protein